MSYLDKYIKHNTPATTTLRDQRVDDTRRSFESRFMNTPSYYKVKSAYTDVYYDLLINDSSDLKDQKSISTTIDSPIKLGESVQWDND